MRKFKEVEVTFDMRNLEPCDQEYLRTMFYEMVNDKSVKASGLMFDDYYFNANNFNMFNSKEAMEYSMSEFDGPIGSTASHLLSGNKYWLAWTYDVAEEVWEDE